MWIAISMSHPHPTWKTPTLKACLRRVKLPEEILCSRSRRLGKIKRNYTVD